MALSGDHVQQILLDSTYRNRIKYPHPTEFEVTVRPESMAYPSDPLGVGYIRHKDTVVAYFPATTPPRIQLTTGISEFENRILGRFVEVADPVTYAVKSTSIVVGFAPAATPHTFIYVNTPMIVVPGDLVFIRQLAGTPLLKLKPNANVQIGDNSFQFVGGSKKANAYNGMYLRKVSGTLGIDHRITSYDVSTSTITFAPAAEEIFAAATDFIEIYSIEDNEGGLSTMGAVANRASPVNSEIRMEWLRIPRHPLYVNNPGDYPLLINNFSYLIVEFRNRSYGSSGIVQSNNKHVRAGQFIVPFEDISNGIGKFYTLRCHSTIVTQYNPNDIIHFSIKLPNGKIIKFDPEDEEADTLEFPNPDMQVSVLFNVRRILN
jgi:hypothetical protein